MGAAVVVLIRVVVRMAVDFHHSPLRRFDYSDWG
jgi:hypothetical protein